MTIDMSITLNTHAAKELGKESRQVEMTQNVVPKAGAAKVSTIGTVNTSGSTQSANSVTSVSTEDVKAAVKQMKDFVQVISRQLQFDVDDDSGRTVVRVLDKDTGDVIRQIPSDEVLALARHLKVLMEEEGAKVARKGVQDKPVGLLVKTRA